MFYPYGILLLECDREYASSVFDLYVISWILFVSNLISETSIFLRYLTPKVYAQSSQTLLILYIILLFSCIQSELEIDRRFDL